MLILIGLCIGFSLCCLFSRILMTNSTSLVELFFGYLFVAFAFVILVTIVLTRIDAWLPVIMKGIS